MCLQDSYPAIHTVFTHKRRAMPTIVEKQEVLNGRGQVIRYGSGTSAGSYFYKEKIPGERRYKTRRIQGATTIEEAVQAAVEIAFKLQEEQPPESISDLIKSPSGNPGLEAWIRSCVLLLGVSAVDAIASRATSGDMFTTRDVPTSSRAGDRLCLHARSTSARRAPSE